MSTEHPDESLGPLGRPLGRPNPPLGASLFNDPIHKPVGLLSILAIVGIVLAVCGAIYDAIALWQTSDLIDRFFAGTAAEADLVDMIEYLDSLVWPLRLVTFLAAAVFLRWLRQARINAEVLGGPDSQRHSRGWAMGGWFVPVLNFWYPFQVVTDIWRASTPRDERSTPLGKPSEGLLVGWWVMWVLAWVSNLLVTFQSHVTYTAATIRSQIRTLATIDTVHAVFIAIAGILVVLIIRRITAWQDAPTGD